MTDDVIQFPQRPTPGNPNVTDLGPPATCEPATAIDMPSTEFAKLDLDALFNMREWVRGALEAKGAKIVGAGIGVGGTMGIADVQIELDGCQCNIEIRPLGAVGPQSKPQEGGKS
jgi:hypothetical protein